MGVGVRDPVLPVGSDPVIELVKPISQLTHGAGLEMEPSLSPDGNYLAYTTDDRGNLDVVVLPLAGGNVTRVTESEADDAQAVWSPDGSRLAFVSARDRRSVFFAQETANRLLFDIISFLSSPSNEGLEEPDPEIDGRVSNSSEASSAVTVSCDWQAPSVSTRSVCA